MDRIKNLKLMIFAVLVLSIMLSACKAGTQDNKNETSSTSEAELSDDKTGTSDAENNTEKAMDNVTMDYDLKEIVPDGNLIPSSDDTDYDLEKLMPVCSYERTGVKLYAYEDPAEEVPGYQFNKLKLLLEYDGRHQVFSQTDSIYFTNMFGYCDEEYPYSKDFDEGYECDFDSDGRPELLKFIITDYGMGDSPTDIVIFDYDEQKGEYEAYHIGKNDFSSLIAEAMTAFFDEHCDLYTVVNNTYCFENGAKIFASDSVEYSINEETENIDALIPVKGTTTDDEAWDSDMGYITLEVSYKGGGKFSVKAVRMNMRIN